jgi:hypothetical protein
MRQRPLVQPKTPTPAMIATTAGRQARAYADARESELVIRSADPDSPSRVIEFMLPAQELICERRTAVTHARRRAAHRVTPEVRPDAGLRRGRVAPPDCDVTCRAEIRSFSARLSPPESADERQRTTWIAYGALRFGLHASATTGPGWSFGLPPLPSFRAIQLMISPGLP